MAAWWAAGEDQRAMAGAAVTRPRAAAVAISSGGSMAARSNRDKKISRAFSGDSMRR